MFARLFSELVSQVAMTIIKHDIARITIACAQCKHVVAGNLQAAATPDARCGAPPPPPPAKERIKLHDDDYVEGGAPRNDGGGKRRHSAIVHYSYNKSYLI